jgi:hypothetical protein
MSDDWRRPAIDNSSLLRSISQALTEQSKNAEGIRISITPAGEWYKPEGEDSRYWVKWLCWSLVSESGSDLTKPLLAVVHGDLDQDELIRHVREIFHTYECAIDNEIEFDQS